MPRTRWRRLGLLLLALIVQQGILFGPSLIGSKILLPLHLLARPGMYLPAAPAYAGLPQRSPVLTDLIEMESFRHFATRELRAGRLPLWNPDIYAGAPFVNWPTFSPFHALHYLLPSPVTLAWIQLAMALVAALGAYLFFRRTLDAGPLAASVGAWCYPLTGFFVLWQGYSLPLAAAWYPWLLWATHAVVRAPRPATGLGLAGLTCVALVSGQVDIAALMLLSAGLHALFWILAHHGAAAWSRAGLRAAATAACGVALGLLLATPHVLPLLEYAGTGARVQKRVQGQEDRPPVGLSALPQVVLPDLYGTGQQGFTRAVKGPQMESAAAGYAGLFTALLLAPIGLTCRRRRAFHGFGAGVILLSLAWTLDLPGAVWLMRQPPLNILSYNRLLFAGAFTLLGMAVVGLEELARAAPRPAWAAGPMGVLAGLLLFCAHRAEQPALALAGLSPQRQAAAGDEALARFAASYAGDAVLCGLVLCSWLGILAWGTGRSRAWLRALAGGAMAAELLCFAWDRSPQDDPTLYFPKIPALSRLAAAPPGRALGVLCLPPNLLSWHGLRDLRGYDAVDPPRWVDLLELARDPHFASPPAAATLGYVPRLRVLPGGEVRVPPVLDMLGLRYLIFKGQPPPGARPLIHAQDYWVFENPAALPRVYVPRRVEVVADDAHTKSLLGADGFDPREVAYVDRPAPDLPRAAAAPLPPLGIASPPGTAEITREQPAELTIAADLREPALVVLTDRWDPGWVASLNGREAPILRANYGARGVAAPAGRSTIVMRYRPASLRLGLWLMLAGIAGGLLWAALGRPRRG